MHHRNTSRTRPARFAATCADAVLACACACAVVALAAGAGCATAPRAPAAEDAVRPGDAGQAPAGLSVEQRRLNEESFDFIWTTIRDKHWDPTLGGIDWPAVRDELRPRVTAARTTTEARAAMDEMLRRLGQSHFQIFPAHLYDDVGGPDSLEAGAGTPGLVVRVVDGSALVVALEPGAPAAAQGVGPGWEILRVAGEEVGPRLAELTAELQGKTYLDYVLVRSVERRLRGDVGERIRIGLLDAEGRERDLDLELIAPRGRSVTFGNLPSHYVWFESRVLEDGIGYLAFSLFLDPTNVMKAFGAAMEAGAGAPGMIIDLRGNPGGIGAMAMGMAGWFIPEKGRRLGTMYTRESRVNFAVTPRVGVYDGPLAILVDGLSGSTAEILAGGLKDLGRARIFGTPTAGAALPSQIERLPNGDGFQYAIANYISQGGQALEGAGVTPDEVVKPTRAALLESGDPVLAAASAWIRAAR